MSWLTIVLRVLHIGGGVFWAGGMFVVAGYVEPAATAAGPDGARFMQRFAGGRFTVVMSAAGLLTIVAGIWLLARDSGGFQPTFMGSGTGVTFSIGALAGLVAAVVGIGLGARNARRLAALGRTVQGGGPTKEQVAQMDVYRGQLRTGARWAARLLGIAVLCMAVARYV